MINVCIICSAVHQLLIALDLACTEN